MKLSPFQVAGEASISLGSSFVQSLSKLGAIVTKEPVYLSVCHLFPGIPLCVLLPRIPMCIMLPRIPLYVVNYLACVCVFQAMCCCACLV